MIPNRIEVVLLGFAAKNNSCPSKLTFLYVITYLILIHHPMCTYILNWLQVTKRASSFKILLKYLLTCAWIGNFKGFVLGICPSLNFTNFMAFFLSVHQKANLQLKGEGQLSIGLKSYPLIRIYDVSFRNFSNLNSSSHQMYWPLAESVLETLTYMWFQK